MSPTPTKPPNARVQFVDSFEALLTTPFAGDVNALCWARALSGDFAEIVEKLGSGDGIEPLDEARLNSLALSGAGGVARDILIADLQMLRDRGLAPELNCIHAYPHDEDAIVPVDVYSFHADSAPIEASTFLCTYHGAPSEGLRNEDALRRIDVAETRAALLRDYGGADDAGFREFLEENCYTLHYAQQPGAQPYSFGLHHLWRIAIEWPESPVLPCIHRAPAQPSGQPARMLLIS